MKPAEDPCTTCEALRRAEARAVAENQHSEAIDCRVLLRQHPNHDDPSSLKTFARLTSELTAPDGA